MDTSEYIFMDYELNELNFLPTDVSQVGHYNLEVTRTPLTLGAELVDRFWINC